MSYAEIESIRQKSLRFKSRLLACSRPFLCHCTRKSRATDAAGTAAGTAATRRRRMFRLRRDLDTISERSERSSGLMSSGQLSSHGTPGHSSQQTTSSDSIGKGTVDDVSIMSLNSGYHFEGYGGEGSSRLKLPPSSGHPPRQPFGPYDHSTSGYGRQSESAGESYWPRRDHPNELEGLHNHTAGEPHWPSPDHTNELEGLHNHTAGGPHWPRLDFASELERPHDHTAGGPHRPRLDFASELERPQENTAGAGAGPADAEGALSRVRRLPPLALGALSSGDAPVSGVVSRGLPVDGASMPFGAVHASEDLGRTRFPLGLEPVAESKSNI